MRKHEQLQHKLVLAMGSSSSINKGAQNGGNQQSPRLIHHPSGKKPRTGQDTYFGANQRSAMSVHHLVAGNKTEKKSLGQQTYFGESQQSSMSIHHPGVAHGPSFRLDIDF